MEQWPSGWGGGFANQESPVAKPLGGFKFESAVHPSEVDQVSTRNS